MGSPMQTLHHDVALYWAVDLDFVVIFHFIFDTTSVHGLFPLPLPQNYNSQWSFLISSGEMSSDLVDILLSLLG